MRISVTITGGLQRYFRQDELCFEFASDANLGDLFLRLEEELLPAGNQPYWNFEKHAFRGPVTVLADGIFLWEPGSALRDGQHLHIKRLITGG